QRALIDSGRKENAQSNSGGSKQQWRMTLALLSRAVKAREAMGSAVTDLVKLELIHYRSA
ncbi:MAG: hypothetical protein VW349_05030, partial [Gammaproteobacteria bacterium]